MAVPEINKTALCYVTIAASHPDSPRNDTANIVELPDGSLLVFWHKFRGSEESASDFGVSDIACRTSRDRGRTWGEEKIVVERVPQDINVQAPAVCLLPNGELLLAALRAHGKDSSSMCLFRSCDSGRTWTGSGAIWERSAGQWLQGGASSIVQLDGGRLILPFHGGTGTQWKQHNTVGIWASDDHGHTWRPTLANIDLPMRGAMEASVAPLPDGRLVMSLRSQLGSVMFCESRDDGETWSLPWSGGLTAPESCTCLRRIPGSGSLLLVWNGCEFYEPAHHHFGQRTPLSLAVSHDAGRSWIRLGDIDGKAGAQLTNLNCTFTSWGDAIVTYLFGDPAFKTRPEFDRQPPDVSELKSVIIPGSFWKDVLTRWERPITDYE